MNRYLNLINNEPPDVEGGLFHDFNRGQTFLQMGYYEGEKFIPIQRPHDKWVLVSDDTGWYMHSWVVGKEIVSDYSREKFTRIWAVE